MTEEPFASGNSLLHRTDIRGKIIIAATYSTLMAVSYNIDVLLMGFAFSTFLCVAGRLPFRPLIKRILFVNAFVALLWLVLPFTTAGNPTFTIGPLTATDHGIALTLAITLKTNTIVLALTALLGTTSIFNLAHGLDHLMIPGKLVHIFFFTWRYVHIIKREMSTLLRSMKARSFTPKSNLHTYRTYSYLLGMVLVRSFDRSSRIYNAMLCRGFQGRIPAYHHFKLKAPDIAITLSLMCIVCALGIWDWML